MAIHRKSLVSGPPKRADKQVTILKAATIVTAAAAPPPPAGVISSKAVSITDTCDYAHRAAKFLEDLKNKETGREGNPLGL
jgi:hypothetical protein